MTVRELIRWTAPSGIIERRRTKFRLSRLGLPYAKELLHAVDSCRYDLWPSFLRRGSDPWTLIDVGANTGEFTESAAKLVSLSGAYLFEPQPSCRPSLNSILANIPNGVLIEAAVGSAEGILDLHLTKNSRMASALRPQKEIQDSYQSNDFVISETLAVRLRTLDSAIPHDVEIGLLKLDVQGFEIEVLKGAAKTLRRTRAILVEINYVDHYEGGADFDEVFTLLRNSGFRISGVSEPYYGSRGEPLWADAIFVDENH